MAGEATIALGSLAMLDRMGEFHRRIILKPRRQLLHGPDSVAIDHIVIFQCAMPMK